MSGVRYEAAGGIATLTLDEADNKNALGATILNGLAEGLANALLDDDVRVITITNEGNTFCAGADLKGAKAGEGAPVGLPEILTTIVTAPKPVVGRIAGHCMGGGVGLAAACDVSIAAEDIRLGFTEVRIGVAPAMISVVCLPKLSRADASELFLTGRKITAAHAASIGLINRAVPSAALDGAISELLDELVAGGPNALAASKSLITSVPGLPLAEAFQRTATLSANLFASPEAAEGITAFRERRPAAWVPRAT